MGMNFYLFVAMITAAAAGLAHLAVSVVLRGRARDIASVMLILAIAGAGAFFATNSNLPKEYYLRLFGEPDLAAEVKAMIAADNLEWLFEDAESLDKFASEAAATARNRTALEDVSTQLIAERTREQMRLLHDAELAKVVDVIEGALTTMTYFIDNVQFSNCRTFLLGGEDYQGADPAVISAVLVPVSAAVRSGRDGGKDWTKVGAEAMGSYNLQTVDHLRAAGFDDQQLAALSSMDTLDPAEMESNCRISHEFFRYMLAEYPPEVAATLYVAEF
jgi:hypothetical protein